MAARLVWAQEERFKSGVFHQKEFYSVSGKEPKGEDNEPP